jgi:hypothetical protein
MNFEDAAEQSLIDSKVAARMLGVTPWVIRQWIRREELAGVRKPGEKAYRIPREAVLARMTPEERGQWLTIDDKMKMARESREAAKEAIARLEALQWVEEQLKRVHPNAIRRALRKGIGDQFNVAQQLLDRARFLGAQLERRFARRLSQQRDAANGKEHLKDGTAEIPA